MKVFKLSVFFLLLFIFVILWSILTDESEAITISTGLARILLADDNESFTDIFCEYLELYRKDGLEMIGVAKNGLDALDIINSKHPNVVLLDILMPKLDGLGVLRKIGEMDINRKPYIIMLSAAGESKMIQSCLDLGAHFYVEKPFDMNVLISKLIQLKTVIKS